jgi:hypothetical protein
VKAPEFGSMLVDPLAVLLRPPVTDDQLPNAVFKYPLVTDE